MIHIYLPYIVTNYDVISNNDFIFDNKELYFLLNTTSYFMLFLYIVSLIYKLFFSKIYDMFSIGLMFIYLHLFSFKTPILLGKNIRKNVKSIVGISPTMVLLFHLPCFYLKM
jgi:hypothetical protein